jgi:hypothetical protein
MVAAGAAWRRAGETVLGDHTFPALSAEDTLMLLCAHGAQHHWSWPVIVADLAAVLNRCADALDWTYIDRTMSSAHRRRVVGTALARVRNLLDFDYFDRLDWTPAERKCIDDLAAAIDSQTDLDPHRSILHWFAQRRASARLLERRRDRWRYRWLFLVLRPSGEDLQQWDLPRPLRGGYFLLRWTRLLGRYAKKMATEIFRRRGESNRAR